MTDQELDQFADDKACYKSIFDKLTDNKMVHTK